MISCVNPVDLGSFGKEPKLFVLLVAKGMQNLPGCVQKQIEPNLGSNRAETTTSVPSLLTVEARGKFRFYSVLAQASFICLSRCPDPTSTN